MKFICLSVIALSLISFSCEKNDTATEEFLRKENLQVNQLIGDWNWEVTNGGWGTNITPEKAGYNKTISFDSDRKYKEYIDSELTLETLYQIDTIVRSMYEKKLYTIHYFDGKKEQNFLFALIDDKPGLYLYDKDCYDCANTHVYSRK